MINYIPAAKKQRLVALFLDWLFISAYLLLLLGAALSFYWLFIEESMHFTCLQTQLIATVTSVIPIILIFAYWEGQGKFSSWGKRKTNLTVLYSGNPVRGSIVRNVCKFLPWQFGHMSTINGIFNGFQTAFSLVFFVLSMLLAAVYIGMVFLRQDGRHLADIIAGSKVAAKSS